jgi:NTE family protein
MRLQQVSINDYPGAPAFPNAEVSRVSSRSVSTTDPRVGLVLGSGAARGLAHVGVIRALSDLGIRPGVVCGASIGALVGGAYVAGGLDFFESWVRGLTTREVVRYLDIDFGGGGGFTDGKRLINYLRKKIGDPRIEDVDKRFATVATNLQTGREVWIREGRLWDAVHASIALPGVVRPYRADRRWLVDGGLVNPVPVSLCRAMEAERIVAVSLNTDILGRHLKPAPQRAATEKGATPADRFLDRLTESLRERASSLVSHVFEPTPESPGLFEVLASSVNIMQDLITRSRMAGEPPDVLIAPRLSHIGLLEFDRADEAIKEGRASVVQNRPALEVVLGRARS